jgi:hypothetical protein
MLEIVDSSLELSRASFERAATRIRRQLSRIAPGVPVDPGQTVRGGFSTSRAGFGPQQAEITSDFPGVLAAVTRHPGAEHRR